MRHAGAPPRSGVLPETSRGTEVTAAPAKSGVQNYGIGVEMDKPIAMEADRAVKQRQRQRETKDPPARPPAAPPRRRGTPAPPPTSPRDACPEELHRASERRRQSALRALEAPAPAAALGGSARGRRRGKRGRSSLRGASPSRSPDAEEAEEAEEDNTQVETQFTTGTIRANADVVGGIGLGSRNRTGRYGRASGANSDCLEVPLSQANDAAECGESQVVWYAATRG